MRSFFTKDVEWLNKWDDFLKNDNRGNHLVYSDWLASYQSYGFDFEVYIVLNDDQKIIGGFGSVIAKSLIFKFYIVPIGPIFSSGFENEIDLTIKNLENRARKLSCCYVQFKLPIIANGTNISHAYDDNLVDNTFDNFESGNFFKYVYSSNGFNWVDFDKCLNSEDFFKKLTPKVRRNINLALKNDFQISYPTSEDDIKIAYDLVIQNAIDNNYSVRSFEDFEKTFVDLIRKKKAFFIVAKLDNVVKGTSFVIDCGNHLTHIFGGTTKEKPDLKVGYLMHWQIIKKSIEMGYDGYNISLGGSEGVTYFKSKFNTTPILFIKNSQYLILKSSYFKLYLFLNSFLKNNKSTISNFLKYIK